jgi:hypothetical protein
MLLPPMDSAQIFVGGEGRSGTTLLRVMLDAHPAIACGPESHFLVDPEFERFHRHFRGKWWKRAEGYGYGAAEIDDLFREFARNWFETYMRRQGTRRWADKTPQTIRILPYLWELFPTAKFVHMIRDGRDVACSIVPQRWGPDNVKDAARRWVSCIEAGVKQRGDAERYMEIRYEDLVLHAERELRRLCAWIGEPFDPAMLDYHAKDHDLAPRTESSADQVDKPLYTSAIGRFRRDLAPRDLRKFEKIAGTTLEFLGYPLAGD